MNKKLENLLDGTPACLFAKVAHDTKSPPRKHSGDPYIVHPARCARRGRELGWPSWLVDALWLHDVVEDCGVTYEDLVARFDKRTADVVLEVTNKYTKEARPDLGRKARKSLEKKRLAEVSADAKAVKLIDRTDNVRDIDPASEFARVYVEESAELAALVRGARDHDVLHRDLVVEIDSLRAKIAASGGVGPGR